MPPHPPLKKKHIPTAIKEAMALHEAGRLDEAAALYTRILEADAKDPNALMNLSTLHAQRGEYEPAAALLKRLLPLVPAMAYPRYAYGNVLVKLARNEEALAAFDRAIALDASQSSYYFNRGIALDALARYEEAMESYDRAIALQPDNAEALVNHSNSLYRLGRFEEALAVCNTLIARHPGLALAYTSRGNVLNALQRADEALADYNTAISLESGLAVAHNNRGNILAKQAGEQADALASYEQALAFNPLYVDAHNNRATALNKLERFEDALVSANEALALNPGLAIGYDTRGNALAGLGRPTEALADYDRALALDPTLNSSYWNKSMLSLLLGDLETGFRLYEHRWQTEHQKNDFRPMEQPLWLGQEPLEGKRIFIHIEQGLGDFLQCGRFIPLLAARAALVIVETPPPLIALFTASFASDTVMIVPTGTPVPRFDYQCPIMSLPLAFGVTVDTIPNDVPYLRVPPLKALAWQQLLGPKTVRRIGLVWSGARAHLNDHNRSIPLATLEPLLAQPYEFHSLQKEVRERDQPLMHHLHDHAAQLNDFTDTAALIAQMDLVISVDTSVAHLAGGLGKPLWVLLPYTPDYRWLLGRDDSPWYPTARLFRQHQRNDWPGVVARVIKGLEEMKG